MMNDEGEIFIRNDWIYSLDFFLSTPASSWIRLQSTYHSKVIENHEREGMTEWRWKM